LQPQRVKDMVAAFMTRLTRKITIAAFLVMITAAGAAPNARADAKEFYFKRAWRKLHPFTQKLSTSVTAYSFTQKLDHSSTEDMRTFQQRYWIDTTYSKGPNPPILYYICGEATCETGEWSAGPVPEHAETLGATIVALEHRYYGRSQPFDLLTTKNLKFLTVANALADLDSLEQSLQTQKGFQGKWISVGASYAGALSAYYRALYPNKVVGALASSAPVVAQENFEEYDKHVNDVAGPQCADLIRHAVQQAEHAVGTPVFEDIKSLFAAEKITQDDDFLYVMADIAASAIQYGFTDQFCEEIENTLVVDSAPTDPYGLLAAYGKFAQQIYQMWGIDAYEFSSEYATHLDPASYYAGMGERQWFYQSCTEFGFFQNAYHDPTQSVRSAHINPAYHRDLCKRLFGITTDVAVAQTNHDFLQPILNRASNILFTNGSEDPWALLSLTQSSMTTPDPHVTLFTIDGASHCADIAGADSIDPDALAKAKQMFDELAKGWSKK
jgi:pimeloyl-ACP methyl ester carboxylesterase